MEAISGCLTENEQVVRSLCRGCDDIILRPMRLGFPAPVSCLAVYIETAVSNMMLRESVLGQLFLISGRWTQRESAGLWKKTGWGFPT